MDCWSACRKVGKSLLGAERFWMEYPPLHVAGLNSMAGMNRISYDDLANHVLGNPSIGRLSSRYLLTELGGIPGYRDCSSMSVE